MGLVVDAHVHIYPAYDLAKFFRCAVVNLHALAKAINQDGEDLSLALCLTERGDCHFFRSLKEDEGKSLPECVRLVRTHEDNCHELIVDGTQTLFLFSGRQIVTSERLELLALTIDADISDGVSFRSGAATVRELGGIPVLNWAPGKWMFRRRPIVQEIIGGATPSTLAICDTTLRPICWPKPDLMRFSTDMGLSILAGSDPLPQADEVSQVGRYGILFSEGFDKTHPLTSIRKLLLSPSQIIHVGRRGSPLSVAHRIFRHMACK